MYTIDEAQLKQRLAASLPPGDVEAAVRTFKASSPGAGPAELYFKITSWRSYIRNATIMAEKRAALNGARNPTWMYQVTWRSPAEGGRRFSQHTLNLPFMLDNVSRAANLTGAPSEETRVMADNMANAWIAFARTGNPNHRGLPAWPTYDPVKRPVMEFEVPARVVNDPFPTERRFMERYQPVRARAGE